jgi:Bifunctional DNA primase/polymerase, N-terminal
MFCDWARDYWVRGLNPIPGKVDESGGKVPLVGWRKFQTERMTEKTLKRIIEKHADAPLLMVPTGSLSDPTVVDIDGGKADLDWAVKTFGRPRTLVSTANWGYHLWYRSSGERKANRVLGRTIDILGEGALAVVPGSEIGGSLYSFERGGVETSRRPIEAKGLTALDCYLGGTSVLAPETGLVFQGQRDNKLFLYGKDRAFAFQPTSPEEREAKLVEFEADLLSHNAKVNIPPLPELQVRSKARNLFKKLLAGTLFPINWSQSR